ncbi:MAG: TolC family outer membrane protein [Pseudomonadota bacterium]|nr:TolC family outer membrane protein [Pseudomonadota bacterium]
MVSFFSHAFVLFAASVLAANVHSANLVDIYQLAINNDPRYQGSQAAYQAAQEEKRQAQALLLPTVNFAANLNKNSWNTIASPTVPVGNDNFSSGAYELSLNQPLINYDYFRQLRQSDYRVGAAQATLSAADQALTLRVAERYFGLLSAVDNLGSVRVEKEATERQLKQARQRFEVGMAAMTDVHESQAAFDLVVAQEIIAENQLASEQGALAEITGHYVDQLSPLAVEIPLLAPEPADIDKWQETALMNNFELIATQLDYQHAREEIKRQRAGHMPTLELVAAHQYYDESGRSGGESESRNQKIGLQLNLPLFAGGATSSRTRQAHHVADQYRETYEASRRATLRQTRDAYLTVLADIKTVNALKQVVISAKAALNATTAGVVAGTRTTTDLLNARRELFRKQRDHSRARYNYILQTLRLKQAAGILAAADLERINGWLQVRDVAGEADTLLKLSSYQQP